MKKCRLCGEFKSLDDFYTLTRNKDNKDSRCKVCMRDKAKEVYIATKDVDKIKERNLRIRYGLSVEEYDKLVSDGCFICGTHEKLCIDHDHECCPGKESCGECIRGVLCWNHNLGEARFKSIAEIERLLEYRSK